MKKAYVQVFSLLLLLVSQIAIVSLIDKPLSFFGKAAPLPIPVSEGEIASVSLGKN